MHALTVIASQLGKYAVNCSKAKYWEYLRASADCCVC